MAVPCVAVLGLDHNAKVPRHAQVRVTVPGKTRNYISYATALLTVRVILRSAVFTHRAAQLWRLWAHAGYRTSPDPCLHCGLEYKSSRIRSG